MRINRLKRINKNIAFYVNNFGFRKPLKILIDGTFCYTALKDQLNIQDQLNIYLGEDIKLVTTQCVVVETEKLGSSVYGAMLIVKKFQVHKCEHKDKPATGSSCLLSMIHPNNPKRYIIATQDRSLQEKLRTIPGVPLLYFHRKGPTLEAPSKTSIHTAHASSSVNLGITKFESVMLTNLKETELGLRDGQSEHCKKRKRKGGPNPLSCKKKIKKDINHRQDVGKKDSASKGKRRKRTKIAKHVKEELRNMKLQSYSSDI